MTVLPIPAILGVALVAAALVLQIVGLATPDWIDRSNSNFGLWKTCVSGTCTDIPDANLTGGLSLSS